MGGKTALWNAAAADSHVRLLPAFIYAHGFIQMHIPVYIRIYVYIHIRYLGAPCFGAHHGPLRGVASSPRGFRGSPMATAWPLGPCVTARISQPSVVDRLHRLGCACSTSWSSLPTIHRPAWRRRPSNQKPTLDPYCVPSKNGNPSWKSRSRRNIVSAVSSDIFSEPAEDPPEDSTQVCVGGEVCPRTGRPIGTSASHFGRKQFCWGGSHHRGVLW